MTAYLVIGPDDPDDVDLLVTELAEGIEAVLRTEGLEFDLSRDHDHSESTLPMRRRLP